MSEQIQNANEKIVERGNIDTTNTQKHGRSLHCLDTGTSIKRGGVKLVLWVKISPFREMML